MRFRALATLSRYSRIERQASGADRLAAELREQALFLEISLRNEHPELNEDEFGGEFGEVDNEASLDAPATDAPDLETPVIETPVVGDTPGRSKSEVSGRRRSPAAE